MNEVIVVEDRLIEIEGEIESRLKRQWDDVLVIGRLAIEAKSLLGHGKFTDWIKQRLQLSPSLIRGYMRFEERLGKTTKFAVLPVSAGLLLASPSVPDGALAEIQRRLEDGETFKVDGVESIIDKYKVFQSVHIGAQALLQEYGANPDGTPTKKINRSDVTSLAVVTGEALERGVVNIEGEDQPLPDMEGAAVFKPIPDMPGVPIYTIPNTVKAAAKSASAQRQSEHVEDKMPVLGRYKATVAGLVVNGFVTLKLNDPDVAERLANGQMVTLEF